MKVLVVCLVFLALVHSFTLQVEPKTKECFSEDYQAHRQIKLNWQVIRGGLLDISITVKYEGNGSNGAATTLYEKLYFEAEDAPGLVSILFNFFLLFFLILRQSLVRICYQKSWNIHFLF